MRETAVIGAREVRRKEEHRKPRQHGSPNESCLPTVYVPTNQKTRKKNDPVYLNFTINATNDALFALRIFPVVATYRMLVGKQKRSCENPEKETAHV